MVWIWRVWRAKSRIVGLIESVKVALEDDRVSAEEAREISKALIAALEKLELLK